MSSKELGQWFVGERERELFFFAMLFLVDVLAVYYLGHLLILLSARLVWCLGDALWSGWHKVCGWCLECEGDVSLLPSLSGSLDIFYWHDSFQYCNFIRLGLVIAFTVILPGRQFLALVEITTSITLFGVLGEAFWQRCAVLAHDALGLK